MLDTVPLVMQVIRRYLRKGRSGDLSIPQLRTLFFINLNQHDCPSLSAAADFIGLSLPAMSRLVDALVRKALVARTACPDDRRQIRLALTDDGRVALEQSWKAAHARLTQEMCGITVEQRTAISAAMNVLREAFDPQSCQE